MKKNIKTVINGRINKVQVNAEVRIEPAKDLIEKVLDLKKKKIKEDGNGAGE